MRMRPDVEFAEELDTQLAYADHIEALGPNMFCWSKTIRGAIGLAVVDLAKRLNLSQPAVTKLERNEAAGTISIAKLEALADALDCRLVYGFVPNHSLAETAGKFQEQQDAARKAKRKIPRQK